MSFSTLSDVCFFIAILLLLLAGDVETSPGPYLFRTCPNCDEKVHVKKRLCKCGYVLNKIKGRPIGTTADAGYMVSTGDAELHCSHSDLPVVENLLQSDLNAVACWLCSSQLSLNVVKSNSMLIGSQQRIANKSLKVSIGGSSLTQVNSVRYLEVIIDNMLSWNLHISNVVSRVRSCVASIIRYGTLPPAVLLYTAFVLPFTVMLFGIPPLLNSLQ